MKKAIVTGGAGFIGSHMVDLLIKKKFQVIVIDNFIAGNKKNLIQHKRNKNLKIINIDIKNIKKDNKNFKNVKYIFHFAGLGDIVPSIEKPKEYIMNNAIGTLNILEAARYNNVKKLVYAASASCYGINNKKIDETAKINLEHPYALSKYMGEELLLHWVRVYGLNANSIRIFNAYGTRSKTSGQYGAVFGVFFKQKLKNQPLTIVGNGKQKRDFVYVTDVAKAFYQAAILKKNGQIFNIASNKPIEVNYLASLISSKKIHVPKRPGEPFCSWGNINKAKKNLKWTPKVKFKDGVNKMLKNINYWNAAPLWTKKRIKLATKTWFKYLKK